MSVALLEAGALLTTERGAAVRRGPWHAEGSYARVYRGLLDGVPCAVKAAKTEVAEAVPLIRTEAALLARLEHPAVVRLLDGGLGAAVPFLALEWLEGDTLHDTLRAHRRLPLRHALDLLGRLAGALEHLHALGLAHGDVRAENVILARGRGAVLIDPWALPGGPPDRGAPSAEADVIAAARLFHQALTGATTDADARCGGEPASGYNGEAVRLCAEAASGALSARDLCARAVLLRHRL